MSRCRCSLPLVVFALLPQGCGHTPPPGPSQPPLSQAEMQQAKRLLAVAEVAPKQLPGDGARRQLVQLAGQLRCPCDGIQGTLAECAERRGATCLRAPFAVRAIVRGLARDESEAKITARLMERFGPREPEQVELSGAPCEGAASAPVTMVLFSDFQCPFCAMGAKLVKKLRQVAGDRLRICFKHWPLTSIHPRAQLAAQAAVAAQQQGKFWPMHDRLFAHQDALERSDLEQHAEALGLDLTRFKAALDADETRERVARDAAEAARLNLRGTPTFLINGRRMTDPKTVPDFLDWIAEALALARAGQGGGAQTGTGASSQPASQPSRSAAQ